MEYEISFTDNSHLFGIPAQVVGGIDFFMEIPILKDGIRDFEELRQWVHKTAFLRKAGIDCHLNYVERG